MTVAVLAVAMLAVLFPAGGSGPTIWSASTADQLGWLSVSSTFEYRLTVDGSTWLTGGGVGIHCDGQRLSTADSTLVPVHGSLSPNVSGVDPVFGDFAGITQEFVAANAHTRTPDGGPTCKVTAAVRYYTLLDIFEFGLTFEEEATGTAAMQLPASNTTETVINGGPVKEALPTKRICSRALWIASFPSLRGADEAPNQ